MKGWLLVSDFCSPEKVQEVQAEARRLVFPKAAEEVPCRLCKSMMPNPVIHYGAFSNWCLSCLRSKLSKRSITRMQNRMKGKSEVENKMGGVEFTGTGSHDTISNSSRIEDSMGKPQLTLRQYLKRG